MLLFRMQGSLAGSIPPQNLETYRAIGLKLVELLAFDK